MATEINLGGTIYVPSKQAAELMGYTQDYVGQLARSGAIEARRVSGLWYVTPESLQKHKASADEYVPKAPNRSAAAQEIEAAVSFDGKDYVSSHRASKVTGYNQDYIGQLARSGQILSRQIGNRWYVDRQSLLEHKASKDAMLRALQSESVGLAKQTEPTPEVAPHELTESDTHFQYLPDEATLLPDLLKEPSFEAFKMQSPATSNSVQVLRQSNDLVRSEINQIPIRVIENFDAESTSAEIYEPTPLSSRILTKMPNEFLQHDAEISSSPLTSTFANFESNSYPKNKKSRIGMSVLIMFMVISVMGSGLYVFSPRFPSQVGAVSQSINLGESTNPIVRSSVSKVSKLLEGIFSKEVVYKR